MKLAMMAPILLLATSLAAQNAGSPHAVAASDNTSFSLPEHADTCYVLRTYYAPRSERPKQLSGPMRTTTCTPASRFRVKYLPNATEAHEPVRAKCPECDDKPGAMKK